MLVGALGHGRPRDVARLGSAVLTWTVVVLGACSVAVGLAAEPLAERPRRRRAGAPARSTSPPTCCAGSRPSRCSSGPVWCSGGSCGRTAGRWPRRWARRSRSLVVGRRASCGSDQLAASGDATGVPGSHLAVLAGGTTLAALVLVAVPAVLVWRTGVALRAGPAAHRSRWPPRPAGVAQALVARRPRGWSSPRWSAVVVTFRSGRGGRCRSWPTCRASSWSRMRRCCCPWCPTPCPGSPRVPTARDRLRPSRRRAGGRPTRRPRPCSPGRRATSGHRRSDTLAGRARAATALGAVAPRRWRPPRPRRRRSSPRVDAAQETTQGRAALDALAPGLWAGAPSLVLLGPRRRAVRRPLRAGPAVRRRRGGRGGLAARRRGTARRGHARRHPDVGPGGPRGRPGRGPDTGHPRPARRDLPSVGAGGPGRAGPDPGGRPSGPAAAGAAAGILVGRWWVVEGPWANAGVAVALAVLGAAVTGGVLVVADRATAGQLRDVLGPSRQGSELTRHGRSHAVGPDVPGPTGA